MAHEIQYLSNFESEAEYQFNYKTQLIKSKGQIKIFYYNRMDFGLGSNNITATDYLSKSVLPCLDHCLTRLIDHIIQTGEIDKWKALKEEEYTKARREAKRKQRKEAGESVSGSDEWEDSENSEEKEEVQAPFDPVGFLSNQILEYRQNYPNP